MTLRIPLLTLVLAATPLLAQQQTTTSTSVGDRNASINASATAQQDQTRTTTTPPRRAPGVTQVTPVEPLREGQPAPRRTPTGMTARQLDQAHGEPDVLLDIPNLSVDEITLEVDNLRVHLALDARVANLVQLTAGADASIERVHLTIKGVQAEAHLVVRLDNVAAILDRTLTTIDRNPEILTRLLQSVDTAVGTVGNVANTALQPGGVVSQTVGTLGRTLENVTAPGGVLTQTVNTLGQTVQTTLSTTGNIVERTLDTTGKLVNERTVGRLLDLRVLNETTNAAGQLVRQVRDTAGNLIEYTVEKGTNRIISSRVLQQATGAVQQRR